MALVTSKVGKAEIAKKKRKPSLTAQQRFQRGAKTFAAAAANVLDDTRLTHSEAATVDWKHVGKAYCLLPPEISFLQELYYGT